MSLKRPVLATKSTKGVKGETRNPATENTDML